jgi:glycosyltransferase involved in cell wall biosynthesis
LQRALRSVAAQVVRPSEVIVVDDGPESERHATQRAVSDVDLPRLRLVANARGKGASGARNTGADCSQEELLAFLDDDDEWLPSYLCAALVRLNSAALDMTCTDLSYRYDDGTERLGKQAPDQLVPELFLFKNPGLVGSNLIIRRSLYLEIGGFDESLPSANDIDFGLRLSLRGAVRYAPVHEALVRHYQHAGLRLSMPRTPAVCAGLGRFYHLHAGRMTEAQKAQFRSMVRRVWGIDEFGNLIEQ